jgi:SAM-dependent methyltransferase
MKANTSRSDRLNFDSDVESYDTARPGVPLALVEQIRERARLSAGADVLEIGAATGQLTLPLRTAGFRVVAIEPGDRLRQRLAAADLLAPDGSLVLLWNCTFLPADLQRELNEKVFAPHAIDAVREPDDHEETLVALTAEGRDELAARVRAVLAERKADRLELTNYVYCCIAPAIG